MFSFKRYLTQFNSLLLLLRFRHLILLGIAAAVILIQDYLAIQKASTSGFSSFEVLTVLFIIILSNDVFFQLRQNQTAMQYLLTPASSLEKYLAAWSYSAPFALIIMLSFSYLVHFLGLSLGNAVASTHIPYGFPDGQKLLILVNTASVTHAFFFFGSVLFKKHPVAKTIGLYLILVMLTSFIFVRFVLPNWSEFGKIKTQINGSENWFLNEEELKTLFKNAYYWIAYVFPLVAWTVSYYIFKRKEQ